jgi:ATP-dependent helicase/nuclease subunit A
VRPHLDEPRWTDAGIAAGPGDGLTALVPDLPRADRVPEQATDPLEPRDDGVRRLGLAVHRALQWISKEHGPLRGLEHAARAAAREFGLDLQVAASVATIVARMRASAELARFFDPRQLLWAGDEVELAYDGTVIRIDRLVRLGPVEHAAWWVLDYKLESDASDDPAYRGQLMRYRDAVRSVSGGESVHAAIATADGRLHLLN